MTNIAVNSTNGVVTLSGHVDSAEIKSKAVAIVWDSQGRPSRGQPSGRGETVGQPVSAVTSTVP